MKYGLQPCARYLFPVDWGAVAVRGVVAFTPVEVVHLGFAELAL